ncbi:MAG TPA: helix-turn-helix transcriptional regulator [bacterium]|nr:helix-turn-helix transcriptional regulator [bacterium]
MPEATKKPIINADSIIQALVPNPVRDKALEALHALGCQIVEESIQWRDAFPSGFFNHEPAVLLRGARGREEMTQEQLALATGIPRRHISEMENGKRPIGKENAKKLAQALNTDYRIFL